MRERQWTADIGAKVGSSISAASVVDHGDRATTPVSSQLAFTTVSVGTNMSMSTTSGPKLMRWKPAAATRIRKRKGKGKVPEEMAWPKVRVPRTASLPELR